MTELTPEQRNAIEAAGWTEAETAEFVQALATFRDGLPPRQRDALNGILAASAAASGAEVTGYLTPVTLPLPNPDGVDPLPIGRIASAVLLARAGFRINTLTFSSNATGIG